jgi:hypothetical protein
VNYGIFGRGGEHSGSKPVKVNQSKSKVSDWPEPQLTTDNGQLTNPVNVPKRQVKRAPDHEASLPLQINDLQTEAK